MSYQNSFNYEDINFDDFNSYPSKIRKEIINDYSLLVIMVKKVLSEDRFSHSMNVAYLARDLAVVHHVNPYKAFIAGILHDVTKEYNDEFHNEYLKYFDPDKLDMPESIKHSFTAKYYLKVKLNMHDKDILNAIYNHTICNSKDKLSLILYIADKRELSRFIDDGIVELAYKDLYKAFNKVEKSVEKYLKEVKNERIIKSSL